MFAAIDGIKRVLSTKPYAAAFVIISILIFIVYSVLLQSSALNLSGHKLVLGLDPAALIASIALSTMLSLSIVLSIFAASRSRGHVSKMGIGAVVTSIVPLALCCSTIIPSVLAAIGMGASAIISTAGYIQGPLAVYEPVLLAVSFVLLALSIYITSRSIAKSGECCVVKS